MSRWDQKGIPHRGWSCIDVIDLGDDGSRDDFFEQCSMCGQEKIRYVHVMCHPKFVGEQRVGCVCAGKMTDDYAGAKARERVIRNKSARKKKWLSRKWRTSASGNKYINIDGLNIGVFVKNGRWSARIEDQFSKKSFSTEDEAKLHLFEAYWKKTNEEKLDD